MATSPRLPRALWRGDLSRALGRLVGDAMLTDLTSGRPPPTPRFPACEPAPSPPGESHAGLPGRSLSEPTVHPRIVPSTAVSAQRPPLPSDICVPSSCPGPPGRPQPARSVAAPLGVSHEERPLSPLPAGARSCLPHAHLLWPGPRPMAACSPPGAPQGSFPTAPGVKAGVGPRHVPVVPWGSAAASVE